MLLIYSFIFLSTLILLSPYIFYLYMLQNQQYTHKLLCIILCQLWKLRKEIRTSTYIYVLFYSPS